MESGLLTLTNLAAYDYGMNRGSSAFGGFFVLLYIAIIVLAIVSMWKVFTKAGKPGWAAIVPLYNYWVLAEVAGRPGWFGLVAVLICAVPFLGWIAALIMLLFISMDIAVKFGKSTTFGVVGLWLFSIIGFAILAFGPAKYDASRETTTPKTPGTTTPSVPPATPQQ
jgi:hypothetical protein